MRARSLQMAMEAKAESGTIRLRPDDAGTPAIV